MIPAGGDVPLRAQVVCCSRGSALRTGAGSPQRPREGNAPWRTFSGGRAGVRAGPVANSATVRPRAATAAGAAIPGGDVTRGKFKSVITPWGLCESWILGQTQGSLIGTERLASGIVSEPGATLGGPKGSGLQTWPWRASDRSATTATGLGADACPPHPHTRPGGGLRRNFRTRRPGFCSSL